MDCPKNKNLFINNYFNNKPRAKCLGLFVLILAFMTSDHMES